MNHGRFLWQVAFASHITLMSSIGTPCFAKASETQLGDVSACLELGAQNAMRGEDKKALFYYQRALKLEPMSFAANINYGNALALAESGAASPAEQYRNLSRSGEESTLERFLPAPKKEADWSRQEDEQTRLAWEHWFFDLRSAIQKEVEARCMAASFRRSHSLVTSATFVVSKDGQVTRLELVQQSANNTFDSIVTDSITAMKGSQLLKFPEGANCEFIDVSTTHVYLEPRVIKCRAPESE
jgi:hypothetical protein